jgi:hypothetical protein
LSQNNSKVREISYTLVPHRPYPLGLSVSNNIYKLNLGDLFDSWLQPGQPVEYDIRIEQTTRRGITYTSGMKIGFIVDKVTHSPNLQYYKGKEIENILGLIN